jgi:hypothetical protein
MSDAVHATLSLESELEKTGHLPGSQMNALLDFRVAVALILTSTCHWAFPAVAGTKGVLHVAAVDQSTNESLPVRMHLLDKAGKPVLPPGLSSWKDHFVFDGTTTLELRPGSYTFEIERGPEYKIRRGNFEIKSGADDTHAVEMERFVDMKSEGWWSGDLHVHRSPKDIELLMRAEDLHVAPLITWWNEQNAWADTPVPSEPLVRFDKDRFYHLLAGEHEREGGALLYFNLASPLPLAKSAREYPSPSHFLEIARQQEGVHVDIEKPFWWDVPVWISSGKVDSIGLANNHLWRSGGLDNEAWGKPRDLAGFAGPQGCGRWSERIYYELLNCGIRIPPSAGSASGVLPNPVGYNRVYVYCGPDLTYEKWWDGLRQGKVVVTNGPLLRPLVNEQLPGHVFTADAGGTVELQAALQLATREKIEYLEIVRNGRVEQSVRLSDFKEQGGRLPKVVFKESGWMLIRAVTENAKTYRFASTGPYYVEIGQHPRISRRSAQFFLDWVHERARRIRIDDAEQKKEVIQYHRAARDFWQKLVDSATAD